MPRGKCVGWIKCISVVKNVSFAYLDPVTTPEPGVTEYFMQNYMPPRPCILGILGNRGGLTEIFLPLWHVKWLANESNCTLHTATRFSQCSKLMADIVMYTPIYYKSRHHYLAYQQYYQYITHNYLYLPALLFNSPPFGCYTYCPSRGVSTGL